MESLNLKTGQDDSQFDVQSVASLLMQKHQQWSQDRATKEERWMHAWAMYLGTPEAMDYMRSQAGQIVGNVNDDWRHKLNTGKGYEIVETAVAYLSGAFFPNRDYFSVQPQLNGYREDARMATAWMKQKLREAKFPSYWEMYLRQICITGFSCIALPWMRKATKKKRRRPVQKQVDPMLGTQMEVWEEEEYEKLSYNNTKLEVVSSFDCFIDPYAQSCEDASMFRVLHKDVADIIKGYKSGVYKDLNLPAFLKSVKKSGSGHVGSGLTASASNREAVQEMLGIEFNPLEPVQCYEFWGDIEVDGHWFEDVVVTLVNGQVARFQEVPYWAGRPFVVGVAVPVPDQAYGMGLLEPVLGMLHENNILTNQRLDSMELVIDSTYVMVDDGVINPDDVYTAPGHIIEAANTNSVAPLAKDLTFQVSYGEQEFLQGRIDATTGIGAYVSAQAGRNAERVTATEVQAIREAGGTRLSSIHKWIEQTQFIPFLEKWLYMAQQFTVQDEAIDLPGEAPGETNYYAVGPQELNHDYKLHVVGADFLSKQEKAIQDIMSYIELVTQVEQWNALINWEELLSIVTQKFNLDADFEKLVLSGVQAAMQAQEEQAAAPQLSGPDAAAAMAQQTGGASGLAAFQGREAMMGPEAASAELMAKLSGAPPEQIAGATELGMSGGGSLS